jgi:DNA-binding helix-hairpin-helix protein with protein kinase domain
MTTRKITLELLDLMLNDLLAQVRKMKATLLSEQTSLEQALVSLNAKPQGRATLLTSAVGAKRLRSKQNIMRKQGVSTVTQSSLLYLSRLEENQ